MIIVLRVVIPKPRPAVPRLSGDGTSILATGPVRWANWICPLTVNALPVRADVPWVEGHGKPRSAIRTLARYFVAMTRTTSLGHEIRAVLASLTSILRPPRTIASRVDAYPAPVELRGGWR